MKITCRLFRKWIDKWFWRGTRLLSIVGMMMDYMLPNKVMSWKEAWETYFEEAGGALFKDLSRYGIRMPKYSDVIVKEKSIFHIKHGGFSITSVMLLVSIHGFQPMKKWIGYLRNILTPSINITVRNGNWRVS